MVPGRDVSIEREQRELLLTRKMDAREMPVERKHGCVKTVVK